jgi:hypothetical protein
MLLDLLFIISYLGEIARGHWGLCRALIGDFTARPQDVWEGTLIPGRLAFAPITAMTDELLTQAVAEGGIERRQMEAAFRSADAAARASVALSGEEEDADQIQAEAQDDPSLPDS